MEELSPEQEAAYEHAFTTWLVVPAVVLSLCMLIYSVVGLSVWLVTLHLCWTGILMRVVGGGAAVFLLRRERQTFRDLVRRLLGPAPPPARGVQAVDTPGLPEGYVPPSGSMTPPREDDAGPGVITQLR